MFQLVKVYEFSTTDEIKEYKSPIGNNDVPYPVAFGEQNVYFMLDEEFVPIKNLPKLTKNIKNDMYSYYYGHLGDDKMVQGMKTKQKMKNVEIVHKRMYFQFIYVKTK